MKKIIYYLNIIIAALTVIGVIVSVTLYFESTNTTLKTQDARLNNVELNQASIVAAVGALSNDVKSTQIDGAKTLQLVHDLSQYRFQYDPTPSEMKGINNVTATSNVQATIQR